MNWRLARRRRAVSTGLFMMLLVCLAHAVAAAADAQSCPPPPPVLTQDEVRARLTDAIDRGVLWRVSKDGLTHHLFGTIHVGKPDWAIPGPMLRAALAQASNVVLEVNIMDPAVRDDLRRAAAGKPALPTTLRERLDRLIDRTCLPRQAIDGMHPLMQSITMIAADTARDGLYSAYAQEWVLGGFAGATRKTIKSLETADIQIGALVSDDESLNERQLADNLAAVEDGRARQTASRLADAWDRGDLSVVEDYERWCDCVDSPEKRAIMSAITEGRHPAMIERIGQLHDQGQPLFIAVGILHMVGEQGLPRLLRDQGFDVERVEFRR